MNALRQEALRMMEVMPDTGIEALIHFMNEYNRNLLKEEDRIRKNREAFDDLLKLCKKTPDRDDKKELAEYREERYHAYIS